MICIYKWKNNTSCNSCWNCIILLMVLLEAGPRPSQIHLAGATAEAGYYIAPPCRLPLGPDTHLTDTPPVRWSGCQMSSSQRQRQWHGRVETWRCQTHQTPPGVHRDNSRYHIDTTSPMAMEVFTNKSLYLPQFLCDSDSHHRHYRPISAELLPLRTSS